MEIKLQGNAPQSRVKRENISREKPLEAEYPADYYAVGYIEF